MTDTAPVILCKDENGWTGFAAKLEKKLGIGVMKREPEKMRVTGNNRALSLITR